MCESVHKVRFFEKLREPRIEASQGEPSAQVSSLISNHLHVIESGIGDRINTPLQYTSIIDWIGLMGKSTGNRLETPHLVVLSITWFPVDFPGFTDPLNRRTIKNKLSISISGRLNMYGFVLPWSIPSSSGNLASVYLK